MHILYVQCIIAGCGGGGLLRVCSTCPDMLATGVCFLIAIDSTMQSYLATAVLQNIILQKPRLSELKSI